jgi:poly(A) polymerase
MLKMKLRDLVSQKRYDRFIKSNISSELTLIEHFFAKKGFEIFVIGGATRELFLEKDELPIDIDITTSAHPSDILEILQELNKQLDEKANIWTVGIKFGTVGFRIGENKYEITTYRGDQYNEYSRQPVVSYSQELVDDVRRRDFTINSIALSPNTLEVIDYCNGIEDIKQRIIRSCRDPVISLSEDPLRALRCARFKATLNFQIDKRLYFATTNSLQYFHKLSKERISNELTKLLCGAHSGSAIEFLRETEVLRKLLPELYILSKMRSKRSHPHKNVYLHTLKTVERARDLLFSENSIISDYDKKIAILFAALFHDVGKFDTKQEYENGKVSFYNHNIVSAQKAVTRMRELRLPKQIIRVSEALIKLHLRQYNYDNALWSDSAIRRYINDVGDLEDELFILINADNTGNSANSKRIVANYIKLREHIKTVRDNAELTMIRPELNGNEIMEILGLKPSQLVGKLYRYLLEIKIEKGNIGREEVEKLLREEYKRLRGKENQRLKNE